MWPMEDPFGGDGHLILNTPSKRTWVCLRDGQFQQCTEEYVDPLIENNKREYNDSEGTSWGDGKIVASIPLAKYFREIVPAKLNGDDKFIRRWLNDSDNRAFRTRKGRI